MTEHRKNYYPGNGVQEYIEGLRKRVRAEGTEPGAVFSQRLTELCEQDGLADPFKGVTTNGELRPGLFSIKSTGCSTEAIRQAAIAFLDALTSNQRQKVLFKVDDIQWRRWMNVEFYVRQGLGFEEMDDAQRNAALDLMATSLSARGLQQSRDIMRLNHTLGELNDHNFVSYGEWKYWFAILGNPSKDKPWGWQIDGHHLIINYFVLGDQVVMTPLFIGAEPVIAEAGKYKGVAVLQAEQDQGLGMIQALSEDQRRQAILQSAKTKNYNLAEAFKDNLVLDYAGIAVSEFNKAQQAQLLKLIRLYVDTMAEGHASVRMEEVAKYLNETHYAWIGGLEQKAVFYYRIQSPVILIEFDHQLPRGIRHLLKPDVPTRQHIHAVVRTPNGNDYGKDLLRQHYEMHPH
jgi:Protein of unknown function (DUF3500)